MAGVCADVSIMTATTRIKARKFATAASANARNSNDGGGVARRSEADLIHPQKPEILAGIRHDFSRKHESATRSELSKHQHVRTTKSFLRSVIKWPLDPVGHTGHIW